MIQVETFHPSRHRHHVLNWLMERKLELDVAFDLPLYGFIAFEGNQAIAAGFLRRVEGGTGMIDSLISNPEAPATSRNQAIDMITEALIDQGRKLKLRGLMAFSVDKNTLTRSQRHGFRPVSDVLIVKDLTPAQEVK